jgi:hypothetical protein
VIKGRRIAQKNTEPALAATAIKEDIQIKVEKAKVPNMQQ